jgi:hypothetical protein
MVASIMLVDITSTSRHLVEYYEPHQIKILATQHDNGLINIHCLDVIFIMILYAFFFTIIE